jgi:hypothetical protein
MSVIGDGEDHSQSMEGYDRRNRRIGARAPMGMSNMGSAVAHSFIKFSGVTRGRVVFSDRRRVRFAEMVLA